MTEASAEQHQVEEQPTQVNQVNYEVVEVEADSRGELVKFAILAVILLFTVLIIALLRPYIFGTVIPAILGENQPAAPLVESEAEGETIKPNAPSEESEEATEESDEAEEENQDSEETSTEGEEVVAEPEKPEDFPTAVPAQTHTVQAGENLTAIARRYDTTVQAIVAANNITNPDRVTVGTELIIPESQ